MIMRRNDRDEMNATKCHATNCAVTSYASYYNTCRPTCTYEIVKHRNFLIILTTIISVFDGLATILEIGMLIIVRLIEELPNMH